MTDITYHPQLNDGLPVVLKKPSKPTSLSSWGNPDEIATVIPGGQLPKGINGIDFQPWMPIPASVQAWRRVPGQISIDEPPFTPPSHKAAAAGVVTVEPDGRVWLIAPSNQHGGYTATFPKGRVEHGISLQATAIREAYEESGLKVEILGFLIDSERSLTYTRYYLARRVCGSPAQMGWESQAVHLVPLAHLERLLTHKNDFPLLKKLLTTFPECLAAHQIVVSYGGNFVRFREAIRSFRHTFGHWPTTLALGSEILKSVKSHLTPLGYTMLAKRVKVVPQIKHHFILTADEEGNQLDYSTHEIFSNGVITMRDVDVWIWGVSLE